ncbi:MAG TPA: hypothetical protein DEG96_05985 [Candidatus Atribacteria bacterium]|nr:hypothetical protein [Candidatus Atribacteria bacterium]
MANLKKVVFFLVVYILLGSLYLNIFAQDSKIYIENKPIDFISTNEDITYKEWLEKYINKREAKHTEDHFPKLKIIIGDIKGNFIEYDPVSGRRETSLFFNRIKNIRNQGDLKGIFIDNGKIYAVVEKRKIDFHNFPEDIYIILRGIYQSEDFCIWQTIDPPPNQADWDKYGIVYYGGDVEDTHVGMVMFEADRVMKCLSMGYDNRTGKKITEVRGLKTEWDYYKPDDLREGEVEWHRFWYTTQNTIVQYDPQEKAVLLKDLPLTIETERMEMINDKLESTFDPDYNSSSYKWTQFFQTNLDYLSTYYPVLYEIQELARWTALFTALYETGFVVDEIEIDYLNFPYTKTPLKTPVINVVQETTSKNVSESYIETFIHQTILTGGVGLEQVILQKSDLSDFKNEWLNKYKVGEQLVECIME